VKTKSEVRASVLAARRALAELVRADADALSVNFLCSLVNNDSIVSAYAPLAHEPGGTVLLDALGATGARILLPILRDDLDLDWAVYTGDLVPGPRGMREPPGTRLGVDAISAASVVVVPAVAVDRRGIRLGRGGGSYDRALSRAQGLVVALLYPGELVEELPAEPHDEPVHLAHDGHHVYWTEAGRMSHHWHSGYPSARSPTAGRLRPREDD
jgi:5-formyltetrahydrofolate cyclo-ligase